MDGLNKLSDAELAKAIELMVSPSDLIIRDVAVAILQTFGYTSNEVVEQIKLGEYFNSGATFSGLNTSQPMIVNLIN